MGHSVLERDQFLSPDQRRAWHSFTAAHGRACRLLDQELIRRHDLRLAEYEVLEHLADREDGHLRMNELADQCGLSPSGLTRRFDSMVRAGLVRRERCDDDRRGVFAVITPLGVERLEEASAAHAEGVRRLFVEPLAGELDHLADDFDRVAIP